MQPLDQGGVVDSRLRVYGVTGLRVVDESVFPYIIDDHQAVCGHLLPLLKAVTRANMELTVSYDGRARCIWSRKRRQK